MTLKLSTGATALAWEGIFFFFLFLESESRLGPSHPAGVYLRERRRKSLSNIGIVNLYANEAERWNCQSSRSWLLFIFSFFETSSADTRA